MADFSVNDLDNSQHSTSIAEAKLPTLETELSSSIDQAFREEYRLTSTILDTVGALIVVLDSEGRIVRFNATCQKVTGYTYTEIKEKYIWDVLILPEELESVKATFRALRAGHFPNTHENYWRTRTGDRLLISWSNTAILDTDGSVKYIIGTGLDITERKKTEADLRDSQELYKAVIEQASDAILLFDIQTKKLLEGNLVFQNLLGYKADELAQLTIYDIIAHERSSIDKNIALIKLHKHSLLGERNYRHKDGSLVSVEVGANLISYQGREVFCTVVRDIRARKLADESLRLTQFAVDNSAEAIVWITVDGQIAYANTQAYRLMAHANGQLINTSVFESDLGFNQETWSLHWQKLKQQGSMLLETQLITQDSRVVPIEYSANYVEFDGKEYNCTFARDISDRLAAETALRSSQERLKLAQRAGKIGIFEWNIQTNEVTWNEELEPMFGLPEGSFGGKFSDWIPFVHPDDIIRFQQELERVVCDCSALETEFRIVWLDGSLHWLRTQAHTFPNESGQASRMIGVTLDITAHKQAEQTLLASERRYRLLFNCGADSVFVHMRGDIRFTKFIEVNDLACQRLGYTKAELLQMSPTDILPADFEHDPTISEQFKRHQKAVFEVVHVAKDGRRFPVEIHATSIDFNGEPAILAFARDISDRNTAELALKQRDRLLRSVAKATNHLLVTTNESGINLSLQTLGIAMDVDQAYIFRNQDDTEDPKYRFAKQFEWLCDKSKNSNLDLKDWSCQPSLLDIYETLSQGKAFKHYVQKHSDSAQGSYSVLLLPIVFTDETATPLTNQFWGFVGFEVDHGDRDWTENEIAILLTATASIGAAIQKMRLYEQLKAANIKLQLLINLDYLTQVANRFRFDSYLEEQWQKLIEVSLPLSLIMCDIDSFKAYNDAYGHLGGDDCLKQVAQTLNSVINDKDALLARYGGEEFAIILPNIENDVAQQVAEKLRQAIKNLNLLHEYSQVSAHVTLSFGVGTMVPTPSANRQILISRADQALFQAKEDGRDRIYSIG